MHFPRRRRSAQNNHPKEEKQRLEQIHESEKNESEKEFVAEQPSERRKTKERRRKILEQIHGSEKNESEKNEKMRVRKSLSHNNHPREETTTKRRRK